MSHCSNLVVYEAHRRRACGCRGCFPLPGRGAAPHTLPILLSLFQSIGVRQHAPNLQQICVTEGLPSEATEQSAFPILAVSRRQPAPNRLQSAKSAVSSSCLFVVLRAPSCQPRRANLPHSSIASSVARWTRAPASPESPESPAGVFSTFRGVAEPPFLRPYKGRPQTLKGFDPDPYRVSPSTPIVVDLGPL